MIEKKIIDDSHMKNLKMIDSAIRKKIKKLEQHRFDSSSNYHQFLKFACDVGRLHIPFIFFELDQHLTIVEKFQQENKEIQRIFDFSKDEKIYKLQSYYVDVNRPKDIYSLKNDFWIFFKSLDPKTSSHKDNMLLNFLFYSIIESGIENILTDQESIKILQYVYNAKNCSVLRKDVFILLLVEYCMSNKMQQFFKLPLKFYNHVNRIFARLVYNEVLDKPDKEFFIHLFLKNIQKANSFKITRKKKVAICLSGIYRNHEESLKSIKENLVDPLGADVFIHSWDQMSVWSGLGGTPIFRRVFGDEPSKFLPSEFNHLTGLVKYFPESYPIIKKPINQKINSDNIFGLLSPKKILIENENDFVKFLGDLSGYTKLRHGNPPINNRS